jgi:hypothetical protein
MRTSGENLERETGIEPATTGLGSRCSTIELLPLCRQSISQSPLAPPQSVPNKRVRACPNRCRETLKHTTLVIACALPVPGKVRHCGRVGISDTDQQPRKEAEQEAEKTHDKKVSSHDQTKKAVNAIAADRTNEASRSHRAGYAKDLSVSSNRHRRRVPGKHQLLIARML